MSKIPENINSIVSADPYSIKKKLIDLVDKNLGLNNPDTYEAGFLGWLIQAQTTITSDILFNLSLSFNESFTQKAILPSSIKDLAAMFDYTPIKPSPASGKLLITIPYPNEIPSYNFVIYHGSICDSSGSVGYKVDGTYAVSITDTPNIVKTNPDDGSKINIPFNILIKDNQKIFSFYIDIKQFSMYEYTVKIESPKLYVFYDIPLTGIADSIYDIKVALYDETDIEGDVSSYIRYSQVDTLYTCSNDEKVFYLEEKTNGQINIRFGNGVFGEQPKDGTTCKIIIYTTAGEKGSVQANTISLSENITDLKTREKIPYSASNPTTISNGKNGETLEETKQNIIAQISSAKKLTTEKDYRSFDKIIDTNNMKALPQLLRRDGNTNEIDLFTVLEDENGMPLPTTNINYKTENLDVESISKNNVYRIASKRGEDGYFLQPSKAPEHYDYEKMKSIYFIDSSPTYPEWVGFEGKIARLIKEDRSSWLRFAEPPDYYWEYEDPEKILEFVCPFNIKKNEYLNRFEYEYLLTQTEKIPAITNQFSTNNNIDLNLNNLILNFHPVGFYENDTLIPTHISFNSTLTYSSTTRLENVKINYIFIKDDGSQSILNTTIIQNNTETCEAIYSITLPLEAITSNVVKLKPVIYYSGEYYCDYFVDLDLFESDGITLKENLNVTMFEYNTISSPSIEKINLGIENISFLYDETNSSVNLKEGDKFLIGDNAEGEWTGQTGKIAIYTANYIWDFTSYKITSETNAPAENEIYEGVAYVVGPNPTYTPWIGKSGYVATYKYGSWIFSLTPIEEKRISPPLNPVMNNALYYIKSPDGSDWPKASDKWEGQDDRVAIYIQNGFKWIYRNPIDGDPIIPHNIPCDMSRDGFIIKIKIHKMKEMLSENIKCNFEINSVIVEERNISEINNGQTLEYEYFIPLSDDMVPSGISSYNIELLYNQKFYNTNTSDYEYEWKTYAIYSDSLYLRNSLNNICWSNYKHSPKNGYEMIPELLKENNINTSIYNLDDEYVLNGLDPYGDILECFKVYKIPVIEKTYYDANRKMIDDMVLYYISELNNTFLNYRMFTDSVNLKFAKTCGIIENLKYNDIAKSKTDQKIPTYENFTWDIAPSIKVKLYLKPYLTRNVSDIITECKSLIVSFMQINCGFHKPLIRSNIIRYIHDCIEEVESCEILEPLKDIIYFFSPETDLPKDIDEIFSYNPEYIWYNIDKISIETAVLPA